MPLAGQSERFALRVLTEIGTAFVGVLLLAGALGANQAWIDSHFLPGFFMSPGNERLSAQLIRLVIAVLGGLLAFGARPHIGRFVARSPVRVLVTGVAAILAFGEAELLLRRRHIRAIEEPPPMQEPRRRLDARLGWVFVPARVGHHVKGDRDIEYAFDPSGYRVRRLEEPVDHDSPTIVFTGESMIVGEGLTWEETVPAQTGSLMGIQSANVAVSGFASDQAYMRLETELPRFRQPIAVVTLFMPILFDRNLNDDRPHLGPGLVWQPAERGWRLTAITRQLVRYRTADAIERGIVVTSETLRATVALAQARGAVPLIIVPQFGAEEPRDRELRRRILDEAGLPYVQVTLDPSWRIPWDRHPDARATRAIAIAVANRLRAPEAVGSIASLGRADPARK